MGDPHGGPQTSPQHADPHGFHSMVFSRPQVGVDQRGPQVRVDRRGPQVRVDRRGPQVRVDRRVVGWSAGRHVDHPCGVAISPWPARNITEKIGHMTWLPLGKGHRGISTKVVPSKKFSFALILLYFDGKRTSKRSFRNLSLA